MPCQCPCWTEEELSAVGTTWDTHTVRFVISNEPDGYSLYSLREGKGEEVSSEIYQSVEVYFVESGAHTCRYDYHDAHNDKSIHIEKDITLQQAQICKAEIYKQYNSQNR
jgi:hypothetical protein